MVLEQLYKTRFLKKKPKYAYLMGVIYSLIGFISATIIFGSSVGLMSIAFTSILLIPALNRLLQEEENAEIREEKLSLRLLFKDHKDVFEIYFFLFFGIFTTYAFLSLIISPDRSIGIFEPQLNVANLAGGAFKSGMFQEILTNNLLVLLVCFALSLFYGAGSIIFVSWNASVWGAVFGYLARTSYLPMGETPVATFLFYLIPVLPHMISESFGYLSASIVGGVVSKAVTREKLWSRKFLHILTDALIFLCLALILVLIGAAIESFI
jgi:uncharacterized membrane protein SpoIIM required for sporulation